MYDISPSQIKFCCSLLFLIFISTLTGCSACRMTEGTYAGDTPSGVTRGQSQDKNWTPTRVPLCSSKLEKEDARNRLAMERILNAPVSARPVSSDDLISWQNGTVPENMVINQIRTHGAFRPLSALEQQELQKRGVSSGVIRAMLEHPYPKANAPGTNADKSRGITRAAVPPSSKARGGKPITVPLVKSVNESTSAQALPPISSSRCGCTPITSKCDECATPAKVICVPVECPPCTPYPPFYYEIPGCVPEPVCY